MAHAYGAPLNHGHPSVSMSTQPPQHSRPHMHTASRSYSYNIPATSVNVMPGHAPPAYARMSATSDAYGFAQHAHPHPMAFGGGHGPGGVPPRMSKTPGPYGNSAYGGIGVAYNGMGAAVPVAAPLPGWTPPAQYHAPQPNVQPTPQAYGYFQWPSSESVDEIPEHEREQYSYDLDIDEKKGRKSEDGHGVKHSTSVVKKKTGGLFESLRRKVAGPDVHLHTLLLHARPVPLTWDVRNAPASASRGANSSPSPGAPLGLVLSAQERAQYATSPPRSHMRITCDLMPWSIDVVAPGARSGVGDSPGSGSDLSHQQQYITLGHLLDTVHAFLQRRVRRSEWLIANERMQEKVVRAFAWRCYNSPGPRGIEERQGPKRVDWLLKRTVFRGLSRIHGGGEGEEEWELHLGQH